MEIASLANPCRKHDKYLAYIEITGTNIIKHT
jgi:hypothetical protein